ncbi:aliphatic sulfonate ABC transporter substrate-binding protein [Falsarthrobacter nasiphocae]|uniref:Putative aliphatic sulfonates-binding protein n=1 Tax=Falsarthrobacter nasiphocae TaxID=189863 RepID=A0AAE3YH85_9MICC|nr:aliphatic sulfonate ABC transporter substrate-binding protein [Falsarthrobacter nasiphocae]MDR6892242.1 sulfonate transport system substrate-binding protein [Falsarthrobacter nasiphocae]
MTRTHSTTSRRAALSLAAASAAAVLASCAGEGRSGQAGGTAPSGTVTLDYATYNPLSLVLKSKGWLEATLKDRGIDVAWVKSTGSNKANEALRAHAIDVGSTAGSAALLARSNGSPIRTISVFSKPEWAALVAPKGSDITTVAGLKGATVAATKGTDPYFFLLQALEAEGLSPKDVTVQNLQHADGWAAAQNGSVAAWAGLDPIMAGAQEKGASLFFRRVDFNTYGLLNAHEDFLKNSPETAQAVVDAYEKARAWALAHLDETAAILAAEAGLSTTVAGTVVRERSNLGVSGVPGEHQRAVLARVGPLLVETGDVPGQSAVDSALGSLFEPRFASAADSSRVKDA